VLLAALMLVISLLLVNAGFAPAWWLLFNAAVVLAAVLFERRGYQPTASNPEALRATGERFVDPTSNQLLEVWEDPLTGVREYRPVNPHPPVARACKRGHGRSGP
jgi:hypothetical protein